jgi:hypothetical protein
MHWDEASMTFRDSAKTFSLTETQVAELMTKSSLADVSFSPSAASFTVRLANGRTVELPLAAYSAFFHEVFAMLEVASRFAASAKASSSPSALAIALSTVSSALATASSEDEKAAVQKVAASFVAALTADMNRAFAGQVIVTAASVATTSHEQVAQARFARDAALPPNPQTNGMYKPTQPAFVEYCSEYKCYCTEDSKGTPFDLTTGCQKGCKEGDYCECSAYGCPCTSDSVISTSSRCRKCAPGYVLHGNSCYVGRSLCCSCPINPLCSNSRFLSLQTTAG